MKWGVRKDRRNRQNGFERKVAKGRAFAKDNAMLLLATGLSATAIVAGQAHLVPYISTSANAVAIASKLKT